MGESGTVEGADILRALTVNESLQLSPTISEIDHAQCEVPCNSCIIGWLRNANTNVIEAWPRKCDWRCGKAAGHTHGEHMCVRCECKMAMTEIQMRHGRFVGNVEYLADEVMQVRYITWKTILEERLDARLALNSETHDSDSDGMNQALLEARVHPASGSTREPGASESTRAPILTPEQMQQIEANRLEAQARKRARG